jgi:hypothetical protein
MRKTRLFQELLYSCYAEFVAGILFREVGHQVIGAPHAGLGPGHLARHHEHLPDQIRSFSQEDQGEELMQVTAEFISS